MADINSELNRFNGTSNDALLLRNSLEGSNDPSTTTKGFVGQFYANTSTNPAKVWQCVGISGGVYTWKEVVDVGGKRTARFTVGTSTAGWTSADCDYLCDGTADQVEIMAALNALPAGGGEVVILDGTYNITASINIPKNNVSIRGNGNATILKRMWNSSVAEGVVTLTGRTDCRIEGIEFNGNRVSYTSGANNRNIYLSGSSNNIINSNTSKDGYGAGISLDSSDKNHITNNIMSGNGAAGIDLLSSNHNSVAGNISNNNTGVGISLTTSSNNTVTGNTCNNNDKYDTCYGIQLKTSSNDNTVVGNTCNANYRGVSVSTSVGCIINGNSCNLSKHYGIYLVTLSNSVISGNVCNDSAVVGIQLASCTNNSIVGNTCVRGTGQASDHTSNQYTIQLNGTNNNYNLITNNNCMGKAVTNGGGTGNTLVNNKFDAT